MLRQAQHDIATNMRLKKRLVLEKCHAELVEASIDRLEFPKSKKKKALR